MSTCFSLKMPGAIYCGERAMDAIDKIVEGVNKVVLFTDHTIRGMGLLDGLIRRLENQKVLYTVVDNLQAEPTVYQASTVIAQFRKENADLIIAAGGGSVMDIAKLCSILDTDAYTVFDLLETPQIGRKQTKTVMIPTTAGTGAEATPNSIVTVPEKNLKVGIVNENTIADYVILDAEMIRRLPKKVAASTGVDALAHAIECFTSNKATPFSNMFAMEALKLIFPNILPACLEQDNMEAKRAMMLAAFYAGVAITASGTTAVHALSYPLGGKYHIAHGVSNAMLLAPVMRFNAPACVEELACVYDTVFCGDLEDRQEKAWFVIERLEQIVKALEIPTDLGQFGVPGTDLEELVNAGMQVTRLLNNNRRTVTREDARSLYLQILPDSQRGSV